MVLMHCQIPPVPAHTSDLCLRQRIGIDIYFVPYVSTSQESSVNLTEK